MDKANQTCQEGQNILFMSLDEEMFKNMVTCSTTKEIQETLIVMHGGNEDDRENNQSLLTQQYKMISHIDREDITTTLNLNI